MRFIVQEAGLNISFPLSVLIRNIVSGFRVAYIPHGPHVHIPEEQEQELLVALSRALRPKLPAGVFCIRFDPSWYRAEPIVDAEPGSKIERRICSRPIYKTPLRKSADVQPPDTVVIDIAKSDEDILAAMKAKWRYNIRLAGKKNVLIESFDSAKDQKEAVDIFYSLYETTGKRDRIALHPKSYYARLLTMAKAACSTKTGTEPHPDVRIRIARHEGQPLASIITIFFGKEATYLYGASGDEKRNLMPAYALQWEAMMCAREAGCTRYDMYGIPPSDDPSHAMAGLYRFKTGFGGEIRHYPGCWDIPVRPLVYAAFRMIEQARLYWHKTIQKNIRRSGKSGRA